MFNIRNGFIFIILFSIFTFLYYMDVEDIELSDIQFSSQIIEPKIDETNKKSSVKIEILDKNTNTISKPSSLNIQKSYIRNPENSINEKNIKQQIYSQKAKADYQRKQYLLSVQQKASKLKESYYKQQTMHNINLSHTNFQNKQIKNQIVQNNYIRRQQQYLYQQKIREKVNNHINP